MVIKVNKTQLHKHAVLLFALIFLLTGCIEAQVDTEESEDTQSISSEETVSTVYGNYDDYGLITEYKRQDKVPEGYKGIYTIEELRGIDNDRSGKYILMNDLSFSESDYTDSGSYKGGWYPIQGFSGVFDGNGYVIRNLRINPDAQNFGLFGKVGLPYSAEAGSDNIDPNVGLIKNLGLDGVYIDISVNSERDICLGTIVSLGHYVMGCYADNVSIKVLINAFADNKQPNVLIGGVCGFATISDSCYANADIDITDNNTNAERPINAYLHIGGVAGFCKYSAASYFKGSITHNSDDTIFTGVLGLNTVVPFIATEKRLTEIRDKITEKSSVARDSRQFMAFYRIEELSEYNKDFLLNNIDSTEVYYILEPCITIRELLRLEGIILIAYTDRELRTDTNKDGAKMGEIYCYTLQGERAYTEDSFMGFDFDNIWIMKDGIPKLQIFQ